MNLLAPLLVTSTLLVSACAGAPRDEVDGRVSVTDPSMQSAREYRCESGGTVVAAYPATDTAAVRYGGNDRLLRIAVSGSGSRYVGDGLEWWTKGSGPGSEGILFRHLADGTSGDVLETCRQSGGVPARRANDPSTAD